MALILTIRLCLSFHRLTVIPTTLCVGIRNVSLYLSPIVAYDGNGTNLNTEGRCPKTPGAKRAVFKIGQGPFMARRSCESLRQASAVRHKTVSHMPQTWLSPDLAMLR